MKGTIYCLENAINGKMYIGQTVNLPNRISKYASGHGHAAIGAAILKYGWQHFSIKVIEEIPVEDLDEAEAFWIAFCDTVTPNGYNLKEGGQWGSHSQETRELIRDANLRRVEDGTHNWLGPESNAKRYADGTHNWLVDHPSPRKIKDGTHNFLTDNPGAAACRQAVKDGTHHFITNHPMKNPKTVAQMLRTRRRNKGILDWIDMEDESDEPCQTGRQRLLVAR